MIRAQTSILFIPGPSCFSIGFCFISVWITVN
jgi:hypothetical protein